MAVLTFDISKIEDLDESLVDSIRAFFKNGSVRISVARHDAEEGLDSTDSEGEFSELHSIHRKGSLSELFAYNEAAKTKYIVPSEAFDLIVERYQTDESFDPVAAIEIFAVPNS